MYLLLKREKLNAHVGIACILFFLPSLFFARSLMSEMPSLCLMSAYCWFAFKENRTYRDFLFLGILAGLSLWFRQTNIVLCIGLMFLECTRNWKGGLIFLIAAGLGYLPKLISNAIVYGDMFYTKNYEPFALMNAVNNLTIYGVVTLLLLPGGLVLCILYKGKKRTELIVSIFLFFLLHLFYRYNAASHSGFVSSIFYNGRYFIPCLSLFAIVYGWHARNFTITKWKLPLTILCTLWIVSFSFMHNKLGQAHRDVGLEFFESLKADDVILYAEPAYRYLNPSIARMHKVIDIRNLSSYPSNINSEIVYLHSSKSNTNRQNRFSNNRLKKIEEKFVNYKIVQEKNIKLFDNTNISFYRMSPNSSK